MSEPVEGIVYQCMARGPEQRDILNGGPERQDERVLPSHLAGGETDYEVLTLSDGPIRKYLERELSKRKRRAIRREKIAAGASRQKVVN